jgi:hypothetical protein
MEVEEEEKFPKTFKETWKMCGRELKINSQR